MAIGKTSVRDAYKAQLGAQTMANYKRKKANAVKRRAASTAVRQKNNGFTVK